jgi:hypothetical protein
MAEANIVPNFGKKNLQGFADLVGKEKYDRIARDSLRDLMLFNNALESEMHTLRLAEQKGGKIDQQLMQKMHFAQDKYNYAMSGFKAFDDDMQRYALIALADAIQDLMIYFNSKRSH